MDFLKILSMVRKEKSRFEVNSYAYYQWTSQKKRYSELGKYLFYQSIFSNNVRL